jgi:hypothetical protein
MVTRSGNAFQLNNQGKTHGSVAKFQNDLRNGNLLQNSPYYNNAFTGQVSTPIQRSSASKRKLAATRAIVKLKKKFPFKLASIIRLKEKLPTLRAKTPGRSTVA